MQVFKSTSRRGTGGVIAILVGLAMVGLGTVASAAPLDQAATPTPVPTCTALPTGVVIVLENPQPGDTLFTGQPVNINGMSLGTALLGLPSPQAGPGSQFANSGFSLRTPNMPQGNGSRTIFVYAKSSVTDTEGVLQVPIYLNAAPTPVKGQVPTAVIPPLPACTPTPVLTATAVPAAATATPVAAAAPAAVATVAVPVVPTPFPTLPPLPTPAPLPAAPVAAPAPAAAAASPAAVAPVAAQTTAPRGGGIPSEFGLALLAVGALVMGGGVALRRRQRRPASAEAEGTDPPAPV
jgi:hypothetical protein